MNGMDPFPVDYNHIFVIRYFPPVPTFSGEFKAASQEYQNGKRLENDVECLMSNRGLSKKFILPIPGSVFLHFDGSHPQYPSHAT